MTADNYQIAKSLIMTLLRPEETVTAEHIKAGIAKIFALYPDMDTDQMFRDISTLTNVWQDEVSVIRDNKPQTWLSERRSEIKWTLWSRYRQYLVEGKGWSEKVVTKLDSTTDKVLNDIGNPSQAGAWDRRGMVVGDVQSGKTASYTGLICKAVDAGYKIIIVLAGMTNDLRSQTQARLDLEFLGYDSEIGGKSGRIGAGRYSSEHGNIVVHSLTDKTSKGDFRTKKAANVQIGSDPLLLVVKKNKTPLELIQKWIESQGRKIPELDQYILENIPLLVLDDEADNASVNTKKAEEDPATINRCIRSILTTFQKSSYVGYTATPFANIFIMPDAEDDLFPRNFIYSIPAPSNYVGAVQIFGLPQGREMEGESSSEDLPLMRYVDDAEMVFPAKHKKDLIVGSIPNSLVIAIRSFALSCAARRARSQKAEHKSMLIHVTRFNDVQKQVIDQVDGEVRRMRLMFETRTGSQWHELISELKLLWEGDFEKTTESIILNSEDKRITLLTWSQVSEEILPALSRIEVRGINGDLGGVLDYDQNNMGLYVIAVGGDKLSRGLTLEGLSVSYYSRPATNYDTLLQMGRWFGYRPGYLDLCRLYTTESIAGWYRHIAMANEELKREFRLMEMTPGLTPQHYGLRVQTHPDGLSITAANKMREGTSMRVAFSKHLCQTTAFAKNSNVQKANFNHTARWLEQLGGSDRTESSNFVWKKVTAANIQNFLQEFQTHPMSRQAESNLLSKYIKKLNEYGELCEWTVALISSKDGNRYSIAGFDIGAVKRTDVQRSKSKKPSRIKINDGVYMAINSNILSPRDQMIDLDKTEQNEALRLTRIAFEQGNLKSMPDTPTGDFIRQVRPPERGLLLIYPLDPQHADGEYIIEGYDQPVIGFAVSFPQGSRNETVEYKVNTVYWRELFGEEEEDDED